MSLGPRFTTRVNHSMSWHITRYITQQTLRPTSSDNLPAKKSISTKTNENARNTRYWQSVTVYSFIPSVQLLSPSRRARDIYRYTGDRRMFVIKPKRRYCDNIAMYSPSLCRYSPNFTWFVTSRLDATRHVRRVERVEPCCSNIADDEQAIMLACISFDDFMLLHTQIIFVPSNEVKFNV